MVRYFDADDVHVRLGYDDCMAALRPAMIAHAAGRTRHRLRSFIGMGEGRVFAQMPAALAPDGYFGAKLVSVFADPADPAHRAHRGVVVLFAGDSGEPLCIADAAAITAIRTAAASALATDALARVDASTLAILGTGHQAGTHLRAVSRVRRLSRVVVWGRTIERAAALADRLSHELQVEIEVADSARHAVEQADIVCTVTSAATPILEGAWLPPGAHVNVVGSSGPGPVEVDNDLVARSRYFVDCREHVLAHGAEFLRARQAGLVDESHIVAEIGAVLEGRVAGRESQDEITVYKSLGHAVQDLAATAWLYEHRDQ